MPAPGRNRLTAVDSILSDLLELVSLSPAALEALLAGDAETATALVGAAVPADFADSESDFFRLRLDEMRRDPALQQWFVRAVVLRETRQAVGHAGFHGPPGVNGKQDPEAVEIGYTTFPAYRGRGIATETVSALMAWARSEHGVGHFILSIAPDNAPSLAIARKLGFAQTGEQWDDEDGLELVFELEW